MGYHAPEKILHLPRDELHARGTRTRKALDRQDLKVEVLVREPMLSPVVEVVLHVDCAGGSLGLTDREELGEVGGTDDGGLVVLRMGADLVGRAITSDGTELSDAGTSAGIVLWFISRCSKARY
jgi:hypothetical protein